MDQLDRPTQQIDRSRSVTGTRREERQGVNRSRLGDRFPQGLRQTLSLGRKPERESGVSHVGQARVVSGRGDRLQ